MDPHSIFSPLPFHFVLTGLVGVPPSISRDPPKSKVALEGAIFEEAQFRFIVCQRTVGRKTVFGEGTALRG